MVENTSSEAGKARRSAGDSLADVATATRGLYAASGGDVTRCEICDGPLDESEPWQRGLDGAGAHFLCIRRFT